MSSAPLCLKSVFTLSPAYDGWLCFDFIWTALLGIDCQVLFDWISQTACLTDLQQRSVGPKWEWWWMCVCSLLFELLFFFLYCYLPFFFFPFVFFFFSPSILFVLCTSVCGLSEERLFTETLAKWTSKSVVHLRVFLTHWGIAGGEMAAVIFCEAPVACLFAVCCGVNRP